ncbi:MAG: hypothetical protein IPO37_24070 [Saprospiraceae bacterium]|nr:hypothetical protein [Saprospiraceae bacterium]
MRKYFLPLVAILFMAASANAQLDSTKVIDNKGTIKYVLKASNSNTIITKMDSLVLYVTPKQLGDSLNNYVAYSDTMAMLLNYLNNATNGLTKAGQTVKLGGALTEATTISANAFDLILASTAGSVKVTGLGSGAAATDSLVVVDPSSGALKRISASTLFNALTFSNGLTKTGNLVELGGALTKPTTIGTDATNVLKVTGLQSGSAVDSLVVVGADGTFKKITQESLLKSGEQVFTATAGTLTYTVTGTATPLPVYSKVWVYRNGAKLLANDDYTVAGSVVTLVEDAEWSLATGDKIEVHWIKKEWRGTGLPPCPNGVLPQEIKSKFTGSNRHVAVHDFPFWTKYMIGFPSSVMHWFWKSFQNMSNKIVFCFYIQF